MKTKLLLIAQMLVPVMLMASGNKEVENETAKANTKFEIKYDSVNSTFTLLYVPYTSTPVKVSILDEKNEKLFTESFYASKGFKKDYIFHDVKAGKYTFELVDKYNDMSQEIAYNKPFISPSIKVNFVDPSEKKVSLTVLGVKKQPVFINILDENNQVVFTDIVSDIDNFSRTYDVSKLYNTNLYFEVIVKEEVFKVAAK